MTLDQTKEGSCILILSICAESFLVAKVRIGDRNCCGRVRGAGTSVGSRDCCSPKAGFEPVRCPRPQCLRSLMLTLTTKKLSTSANASRPRNPCHDHSAGHTNTCSTRAAERIRGGESRYNVCCFKLSLVRIGPRLRARPGPEGGMRNCSSCYAHWHHRDGPSPIHCKYAVYCQTVPVSLSKSPRHWQKSTHMIRNLCTVWIHLGIGQDWRW